jgi:hypothetical protein
VRPSALASVLHVIPAFSRVVLSFPG